MIQIKGSGNSSHNRKLNSKYRSINIEIMNQSIYSEIGIERNECEIFLHAPLRSTTMKRKNHKT